MRVKVRRGCLQGKRHKLIHFLSHLYEFCILDKLRFSQRLKSKQVDLIKTENHLHAFLYKFPGEWGDSIFEIINGLVSKSLKRLIRKEFLLDKNFSLCTSIK